MLTFRVNWLAVLVSVIANVVVGAVWKGCSLPPWAINSGQWLVGSLVMGAILAVWH